MKYILIQDVAFDIPAELGGGVVTYKTGNVVEGFIPDGGGAIIHVVHKTGKGDMVVSLPLEAVKEYAPEGGSKKWLYLGAALVLVYWYVNRDKKKKRQESIPGFSGIGKIDKLHTYVVPTWAVPYLEDGDQSGMTPEQQDKVEKFVDDVEMETGVTSYYIDDKEYFAKKNAIDGNVPGKVVKIRLRSRR